MSNESIDNPDSGSEKPPGGEVSFEAVYERLKGMAHQHLSGGMRHLLMNRARDRMRQKAGGEWARVTLGTDEAALTIDSSEQALALEEALSQLEASDPRAEHVFELRFFAGLTPEQISEILGQTRRTTDRDWRYARAFLVAALS